MIVYICFDFVLRYKIAGIGACFVWLVMVASVLKLTYTWLTQSGSVSCCCDVYYALCYENIREDIRALSLGCAVCMLYREFSMILYWTLCPGRPKMSEQSLMANPCSGEGLRIYVSPYENTGATEIYVDLHEVLNMKGIRIAHINSRSFLPKFEIIEHDFLDGNLEVLCITETWLKEHIPNAMLLNKNYNLLRRDRKQQRELNGKTKNGGGLCIYIRNNIVYEEVDLCDVLDIKDIEFLIVKLVIGGNKTHFLVLVYRPPNSNVQVALDNLRMIIDRVRNAHPRGDLTLIGDYNINYLNTRCKNVMAVKNIESLYGLVQLVKLPTRYTSITSSMIDLCLTNADNSHCYVVNYNLTDHNPVVFVKKKAKSEKKEHTFKGRCYKNLSHEFVEMELNNLDWESKLSMNDPNLQWNQMLNFFQHVADKVCPIKKFKVTKHKPVYVTNEILEYVAERDTVFRLAQQHNDISYWNRGQELRKKIIRLLELSKQAYI